MSYSPSPSGPQDLRPNAYSAVGGSVMGQAVISQYDLYKPNKFTKVFNRHCSHVPFRLMLRAMGFSRGTAAPTTGHYEYPWNSNLITVGAITAAAAGPGNPMIIALDAGDMYNANVNVGGVARQASYPIELEEILLPGDKIAVIKSKNTAVTPHQLTIYPKDPSIDLDNYVNVGDAYAISSNTHAEGSGLPAGRTPRIIDYTNTFQIIKNTSRASGSEMTNEMYFEPLENQPGSFVLKADWDAMNHHEKAADGALIFGEPNSNPLLVDTTTDMGYDVPLSGTEGLIPFAINSGNVDTYAVYSINDFDDLAKYYERERIGVRELIGLNGIDLFTDIENVLQAFLNADGVKSQLWQDWMNPSDWVDDYQPNDDDKDLYLHIGFKGLKKSGYTFGLRLLHTFNENTGAGATVYNYSKRQVIVPKGYSKDKRTNTSRPTMGYEYKMLGKYSRENIMGHLSGAGITEFLPTNQYDTRTLFYLCEIAFHGTCSNHVTIQLPA